MNKDYNFICPKCNSTWFRDNYEGIATCKGCGTKSDHNENSRNLEYNEIDCWNCGRLNTKKGFNYPTRQEIWDIVNQVFITSKAGDDLEGLIADKIMERLRNEHTK